VREPRQLKSEEQNPPRKAGLHTARGQEGLACNMTELSLCSVADLPIFAAFARVIRLTSTATIKPASADQPIEILRGVASFNFFRQR
jgi:hypothetical protein